MKLFSVGLLCTVLVFLNSDKSLGWGERGHHVICEVATRLVESEELFRFLQGRGHMSGHVCNIPDIHWKSHPENAKEIDASHFMDPENLKYKISEVPVDLNRVASEKSKSKEELALELGTLWWRAEQFYRSAVDGVKLAKNASFPDKDELQSKTHPYNWGIFEFVTQISLMGHFVGDASMPYHNTSDYDGWEHGRGGIHAYYESMSVSAMELDLESNVFEQATALKKRTGALKTKLNRSVVEMMKELSVESAGEIPQVEALDKILSPSDKETKTYAKRPPVEQGAKVFKELIYSQMARSSLLLATFWEKAWEEGGSVSFKGYRSYQYPLAPKIVPLDYLDK
jgi:hypothetical protein